MSVPRIRLALLLCLLPPALVAPALTEAAAARQTFVPCIRNNAGAVGLYVRPSRCKFLDAPGVTFKATGLKWKAWGSTRATATGRVVTNVLNSSATLVASRRTVCSSSVVIYRDILVKADGVILAQIIGVKCPK